MMGKISFSICSSVFYYFTCDYVIRVSECDLVCICVLE